VDKENVGKGGRASKKNRDGKGSIYNLWTLRRRTRRKKEKRKKAGGKFLIIMPMYTTTLVGRTRKKKTIASTRKLSY